MRALALVLSFLAAVPVAAQAAPSPVRRLALLVGVNDGGRERVLLRYAVSDAQAFDKVLVELGGVAAADKRLVLETDRAGLLRELGELRARAEQARASGAQRVEVLLYYSGHSDEEGLLLRGERVDYGELRRALDALPADVRIAVLDSCASGAFARRKGGSPRPAFLVDVGSRVRGHAILTSSSEDEASQESDRLGGSYFTHHLISGLRGAADSTRDGRVTLNEAYQFAFHETLARTEKTRGGAQHPAYDIELAGSGDLVMTDLRATSAGLFLTEGLAGRLFVRDEAGLLVVELQKVAGRATELGLAPGRYLVRRETDGGASETVITLAEGKRTSLTTEDFRALPLEATVSRGGPEVGPQEGLPPAPWATKEAAEASGRVVVPLDVSLFPPLDTNTLAARGQPVKNQVALGVVNGGTELGGIGLALVANLYRAEMFGAMGALAVNVAGGDVHGLQAAGAVNIAGGRLNGVQGALGGNVASGDVEMGQFAAGFNIARGNVQGAQGSVGVNITGGTFTGMQMGGVNITGGDFTGVQGAVGLNTASNVKGLQFAAINVGGDVTGGQVGLINVAKVVRGGQFGLINVSEEVHGVPIGLLTFEKKGQLHLELWSSDIQLTNVAVKFGGKYVYTTVVAGVGPDDRLRRFSLGLGFGGHVPMGSRLWLDADVVGSSVRGVRDPLAGGANLLAQGRLMLGVQIFERLAVFGGLTYNAYFAWSDADRYNLTTVRIVQRRSLGGDGTVDYWPGAQAGVRF
jgi:hypothetical protein